MAAVARHARARAARVTAPGSARELSCARAAPPRAPPAARTATEHTHQQDLTTKKLRLFRLDPVWTEKRFSQSKTVRKHSNPLRNYQIS